MDFTTKQWLIGIILVVMLAILIDGFRRMRKARRDSLHMSLNPKSTASSPELDDGYGSEFPNGGARPSQKSIDKSRIDEVKSQYDYGRDISEIIQRGNQTKEPSVGTNTHESHEVYSQDELEAASAPESQDQWVDEGEGDEEYYADKWDEEYNQPEAESATELEPEPEPELEPEPTFDTEASVYEPLAVPKEQGRHHYQEPVSSYEPEPEPEPHEPEQASLNLEESVPVLMESVEEQAELDELMDEPISANLETPSHQDIEGFSASESFDELGDDGVDIRPVGKHIRSAIEPTIDEEKEEPLDTRSANKPRYRSKYFANEVKEKVPESQLSEVLVINVRSSNNTMIAGSDLLMAVLDNGLRFGEMDIFHCHADEDGEGPVLFSMANMLKPGTFELKNMDSFSTVGVTFFLTLPVFDNNNMAAYELMLATAKNVAGALGAELNDDQRSIMTAQTMEHYRERIRDFARRQQLEKNK